MISDSLLNLSTPPKSFPDPLQVLIARIVWFLRLFESFKCVLGIRGKPVDNIPEPVVDIIQYRILSSSPVCGIDLK